VGNLHQQKWWCDVIGLDDKKRLIDEISNKIKNHMEITSEVNLLQEDGKSFIEII
jgi:ATP-dependent DNA helicase RecG